MKNKNRLILDFKYSDFKKIIKKSKIKVESHQVLSPQRPTTLTYYVFNFCNKK
ncbi:hypothetical protein KU06062659_850019 [Flavobacterium psychrophilum]|nr:hypothetical protein FPSM_01173 [Flavobacterium psychrophilum]SNB03512.1 hypothetical protein FPC831_230012 [Flavobacterium psychrophilum]SNB13200.1 hypothetical protein JIP0899_2480002 [Flavobacterium psychrophilum]SNB14826.1 hypothetical protein JIP1600_240006 [Flavobacterium psychrophilum]SNB18896.1 hypothetical protein KU06062604_510034 [Flavobacterium psychrophilum]